MSSPRSSWSGTITLDLLTIPITLGKATKSIREQSLVTLCDCCNLPVDRSERCPTNQGPVPNKVKGVDLGDGKYKALNATEYAHIEDSTKDDRMEILDAQPTAQLPLAFGMGTYYVRAKKDDRAAAGNLAALVLGLSKTGYGLVTKWCKAAKQELAILHPYKGMLLMTVVPMVDGLVLPGDQERAHFKADVSDKIVERVADLLSEIRNSDGFAYGDYADDGLTMRQEAVDRVMNGKLDEDGKQEQKVPTPPPDMMDALMASIEKRKQGEKAKA